MTEINSTNSILENFGKSAADAEKQHETVWIRSTVIAFVLLVAGLTAIFYSSSILAALLLVLAVFSYQNAKANQVLSNISGQHHAMAHLIASVNSTG